MKKILLITIFTAIMTFFFALNIPQTKGEIDPSDTSASKKLNENTQKIKELLEEERK